MPLQPRMRYYAACIARCGREGRDASKYHRWLHQALEEYEAQHGRGAGLLVRHEVEEAIARGYAREVGHG